MVLPKRSDTHQQTELTENAESKIIIKKKLYLWTTLQLLHGGINSASCVYGIIMHYN